jgi:hypothetical protein
MNKHLIAAILIVGFTAPVAAADDKGGSVFYIVFDNTMKKCMTMTTKPTDMSRYKMMGTDPTLGEAKAAMGTMAECK